MKSFDLAHLVITFVGFLVAITLHEAAHAIAAKWLGDKSPQTSARATLNPLPHIDILGTLVLPLVMLASGGSFLFGWAKRAEYDNRYFKKMKHDINLVALAGPGFNILLACLCGIVISVNGYQATALFRGDDPVPRILNAVATANIVIGMFNLIPFPGSDGWRILLNTLRYDKAQALERIAQPLSWVVLLLFISGVLSPIFSVMLSIFYGVFLR